MIELDKISGSRGFTPSLQTNWGKVQRSLIAQESWIMDGDLGQYDAVEARLLAADFECNCLFSVITLIHLAVSGVYWPVEAGGNWIIVP